MEGGVKAVFDGVAVIATYEVDLDVIAGVLEMVDVGRMERFRVNVYLSGMVVWVFAIM